MMEAITDYRKDTRHLTQSDQLMLEWYPEIASALHSHTPQALNDLDIFAADIRNAYLQAPSSQKDYILCGPEFGIENIGKIALIRRALYGGKAAGKDFRNHLRSC